MKKTVLIIVLLFINVMLSQENFKLVKATSEKISIKDGKQPITKYWEHLSKNVKPVIYSISKINQNRKVTFYTDIDSISFDVKPNNTYNFKVLFNSKDTCYAQISTVIPSYYKNCKNCKITKDTIPFTLENDHYIHIKGKVNNSETLDFIFDTGASTCVLNEKGLKKAKLNLDGQSDNEGSSGFTVEQTSSTNHLEIATLNWKNLSFTYIDYKGSINTDGVIGFNIFEDKVVEIDYDKSIIIIHNEIPTNTSKYSKSQLKHDLNGTFLQATLNNGKNDFAGWYLFDTGGSLTVMVGGDYATKNNLYGTMKNIGKGNSTGNGKGFFESEVVELPILKILNFSIPNIPIHITASDKSFYGESGIIGNNVLKRFNVIIDYPNANLYLKPNSLMNSSFKKKDNTSAIIISLITIALLIGFILFLMRQNKSK